MQWLILFSKQDAYNSLLPLYFPRSPQEEGDSINRLPKDIGNELGEPIIPDRQIRIMDKPFLERGSMPTLSSISFSL